MEQLGISRRTLYRWQAALAARGQRGLAPKSTRPRRVRQRPYRVKDLKAVLDVRRKCPFMGKPRIQTMLACKGLELSVSTVGRIIERGPGGRGDPPRVLLHRASARGRVKPKRRRRFAKWARRWKYGSKARRVGELVQVDHMTYVCDRRTLKEFRAVCPVSRFMVTRVYSRATAGNSTRFLMDLLGTLPCPLLSIQVNGGNEFMAEFENTCEQLGVPLHVLPPRRPQWNSVVERTNRSARAEFWSLHDGPLTVADGSRDLADTSFSSTTNDRMRSSHINPQRVPCRLGGCLITRCQRY